MPSSPKEPQDAEAVPILICGGGIVGLVLGLALYKQCPFVKVEIYEQCSAFHEDVGAGMGMYPNGLRVLRDIDPKLLQRLRHDGHEYLYRRWERHDGTEVMVAEDEVLCEGDRDLSPMGIRRWRLQKALYDALLERKIPIHFGKRLVSLQQDDKQGGLVTCTFEDGTHRQAHLVLGADGCKSQARECLLDPNTCSSTLNYTGVTCLMGSANVARAARGICFPSSTTTKCHGAFFPTREKEQCFQFHFPVKAESANQGNWGILKEQVGKAECLKLVDKLRADGWDEKYLVPLLNVKNAVRIGLCLLEPRLDRWVYHRVALLGDAAHPAVPYIGQAGAQMGIEDAGVLALLLQHFCLKDDGQLDLSHWSTAGKVYEKLRIPRAAEILQNAKTVGKMQQKRADNAAYNVVKEELIQRQVFFHETLPILLPGAQYDYRAHVEAVLREEPRPLPSLREENGE